MTRFASKFVPANNTQRELVNKLYAVRQEMAMLKELEESLEVKVLAKVGPVDEDGTPSVLVGTDYKLFVTQVNTRRFSAKAAAKFLTPAESKKCMVSSSYNRMTFEERSVATVVTEVAVKPRAKATRASARVTKAATATSAKVSRSRKIAKVDDAF